MPPSEKKVAQAVAVLNPHYENVLVISPDPLLVSIKTKGTSVTGGTFNLLVAALKSAGIPMNLAGSLLTPAERQQIEESLKNAGIPYTLSDAPTPFDGRESPECRLAADTEKTRRPLAGKSLKNELEEVLETGGPPTLDPVDRRALDKYRGPESILERENFEVKLESGDRLSAEKLGGAALELDGKGLDTKLATKDQLSIRQVVISAEALDTNLMVDKKPVGTTAVNMQAQSQQQVRGVDAGVRSVAPVPQTIAISGPSAPPSAGAPLPSPMSLQYPDITAAGPPAIAGKTQRQELRWGAPLTLDARDAATTANGLCTYTLRYALRNLGSGPAGAFKIVWTTSASPQAVERTWAGIAPGATTAVATDTISLKPGQNLLTLEIDKAGQVKESNEKNNHFQLPLLLNGTCGTPTLRSPGPVPVPVQQRTPVDPSTPRSATPR